MPSDHQFVRRKLGSDHPSIVPHEMRFAVPHSSIQNISPASKSCMDKYWRNNNNSGNGTRGHESPPMSSGCLWMSPIFIVWHSQMIECHPSSVMSSVSYAPSYFILWRGYEESHFLEDLGIRVNATLKIKHAKSHFPETRLLVQLDTKEIGA